MGFRVLTRIQRNGWFVAGCKFASLQARDFLSHSQLQGGGFHGV